MVLYTADGVFFRTSRRATRSGHFPKLFAFALILTFALTFLPTFIWSVNQGSKERVTALRPLIRPTAIARNVPRDWRITPSHHNSQPVNRRVYQRT